MNLIKIECYYVPDINIAYRRIHSLKFRGIHQELSEIQHFKDKHLIFKMLYPTQFLMYPLES